MTVLQILKECKTRNIELTAKEDRLIVHAPKGAMDERIRTALKEAKRELITRLTGTGESAPRAEAASDTPIPITPYQEPLWSTHVLGAADGHHGMIAEAFDFHGFMNESLLRDGLLWIAQRHDILRARFTVEDDGTICHIIDDEPQVQLTIKKTEGSELDQQREAYIRKVLEDAIRSPYDPEKDTPLRVSLINFSSKQSTLILCLPHISADAHSFGVILRDLETFFDNQGNETPLPTDLPPQHSAFAMWANAADYDDNESHDQKFWRKSLEGATVHYQLPTDFTQPPLGTPPELEHLLMEIPINSDILPSTGEARISPAVFFQTALSITLNKFAGLRDVTMVTPVGNRMEFPDAEDMVGCLANQVLVRNPISRSTSVAETLSTVRSRLIDAVNHQHVPFAKIIRNVDTGAHRKGATVPDIFFSYLQLALGSSFKHIFTPVTNAGYPLSFVVAEKTKAHRVMIGYDALLFKRDTIKRLAALFREVAVTMCETPSSSIATILHSKGQHAESPAISHDTPDASVHLLNTLPPASGLIALAAKNPEGRIVLELPTAGTDKNTLPAMAYIELTDVGNRKKRERHIPCRLVNCDNFPPVYPGERIEAAPGLHLTYKENGQFLFPLPDEYSRYIWHNGRCFDLDLLARQWTAGNPKSELALGISPTSQKECHLTAWIVGDASNTCPPGSLSNIDHDAPEEWPAYRIPVPAIPLTAEGTVDRYELNMLPQISAEALFKASALYQNEYNVTPEITWQNAGTPFVDKEWHYSDLFPETDALTIRERYTTLDLERLDTETETLKEAVVHGDPCEAPITYDFRSIMLGAADTQLHFIEFDGTDHHYTGREIFNRAEKVLAELQRQGITPGKRLIIYCTREKDVLTVAWACLLGGICMTALMPPLPGQSQEQLHTRLGHIHTILEHPHIVTAKDVTMPLQNAKILHIDELDTVGSDAPPPHIHDAQPDMLVFTAFTSGSTGVPKAVPLTAYNIMSMIIAKNQMVGPIEDETALSITTLDHVGSLLGHSFYTTYRAASQVYCAFQYVLAEPLRILDIIDTYRVSHTWAPDFTWRKLYQAIIAAEPPQDRWDLSCVDHIISGGENTQEATFVNLQEALARFGLDRKYLRTSWGMSETSSFNTLSPLWDGDSHEINLGIVEAGKPLPGSSARIVDADDTPLPCGSIGAVQVKGPPILNGYLNNPKANDESYTKDGWFRTGDLGMIRNDAVVFCGREKEQIVINGENISQFEIEGFIDGLEGVEPSFTAVIGCRNDKTGDEDVIVLAHSKHTAPAERKAVIRRINAAVGSRYGIMPRYVLLVGENDIPKAALGKVQRTILLKQFINGTFRDHLIETDTLTQNGRTTPDWFGCMAWVESANPETQKMVHDTRETLSLAFSTNAPDCPTSKLNDGLHHALILPERASRNFGSSPNEALAYLEETSPAHALLICHLGQEPETLNEAAHTAWQESIFAPFLQLLKNLATLPDTPELIVVTRNGHAPGKNDSRRLWTATIPALVGAFCKHAESSARIVDIRDDSATLPSLKKEILLGGPDPLVVWRQGKRFVPSIVKPAFPTTSEDIEWDSLFRPDKFCICTGMTGALGTTLLPRLLDITEGRFLLLGRMPAPNFPDFLDSCGIKKEDRPRLRYEQAPLDTAEAIQTAIGKGKTAFENDPGGILHLAAETTERDFDTITSDDLATALSTRHNHLDNLSQAFSMSGGTGPKIVFSSVVSTWAGLGSGLYGPGCAFTEAYVHNERQNSSRQQDAPRSHNWHCLGWSRWVSNTASQEIDYVAKIVEQRGFMSIKAREGALSLLTLLHLSATTDNTSFLAGLDFNKPGVSRYLRNRMQASTAEAELSVQLSDQLPLAPLREYLIEAMGSDRFRLKVGADTTQASAHAVESNDQIRKAEEEMEAVWSKVLHLQHVDSNATFFELGGTSIHIPRLRSGVQEAFGVDIGSAGVFHHPSAAEMARMVLNDENEEETPDQNARARKKRSARARRRIN